MTKRLTKSEFVSRAIEVHGSKYDYSKVNYITRHTPVEVVCHKHGGFMQTPGNHLKGLGCYECKHKKKQVLTRDDIIDRFRSIHGDKYDYSKVIFNRVKDNVIIVCQEHGEFHQSPDNHMRGRGCPVCSTGRRQSPKKKPRLVPDGDTFISSAKKIHGNRYDYSDIGYTKLTSKVKIRCREHGEFDQLACLHLKGSNCPSCARIKASRTRRITVKEFVSRAKKAHGDKYSYDKVEIKLVTKPVIITCDIHGDFEQTPNAHMGGNGCRECGFQLWGSRSLFNTTPDLAHQDCILYMIKFSCDEEHFIKVGHTRKGVRKRFPKNTIREYSLEVLIELSASFYECAMLENEVHQNFKCFSYKPKYLKHGKTECYTTDSALSIGQFILAST